MFESKSKWILLLILATGSRVLVAANAPIQRIDVANLLGSGGSATSVVVSFSNGVSTPCYTKTLPYSGALTLWVGVGQVCVTPVTTVTIAPVTRVGGSIYETPSVPTNLTGTLYSSQISIYENTPPQFDPTNGSLLIAGTIQATVVSNLKE
jgi:hypothetical protein